MRRNAHCIRAVCAVLLTALPLWAADEQPKREPAPAADPRLISDALCGREDNKESLRAQALDVPDLASVPDVWRQSKVAVLELWLHVPLCNGGSPTQLAMIAHRRKILRRLESLLQRAHILEQFDLVLKEFPEWHRITDAWLTSGICASCLELNHAGDVAAAVADQWPKSRQSAAALIGPALDAAEKREPLIEKLRAVHFPAGVRQEIETKFLYYSWTASGVKLLELADWFARPEVIAACKEP